MKVLTIPNFELDALTYFYPKYYPFLLQSVNFNDKNRYSILFAHPLKQITLNDLTDFDFLTKLESQIINNNNNQDLPFTGGWFVYLSYELIGQIEPILKDDMHTAKEPIAIAVKIPSAIIRDNLDNKTYLIEQFDNQKRINQILDDIKNIDAVPKADLDIKIPPTNETEFLNNIDIIRNYIKAGDVFQVNLSQKWQCDTNKNISPTQIYRALKKTNPAPFSALAQFKNFAIISSSPERLFSVNGNTIETRPIAGTHPRGKGNKNKLINHPKERAEHIMLIDLERNDLGRVCQYGSVSVNEFMSLETYPYVHHIVSNIKGKLKKSATIKHLIKALFPGGTITGCPKIRCMQIISELEKEPRGAYTGSLGYISSNGKMDFNILIRTISKQNNKLTIRAGAGIVFDSVAQKELAETKHKAEGIFKIFGPSSKS